jgi:multicomponent Na+:H+ antiporter subunit G
MLDGLTLALLAASGFFFLSGTVGLLRFPDAVSRLHALTKADTLGLGFLVLGLALQAGAVAVALKLVLIWLVALFASASSGYLIAAASHEEAREPDAGAGGERTPSDAGRTGRGT